MHKGSWTRLYNQNMTQELYISVDVETAGPIPGRNALLSIGACLVEDTGNTFYVELQPDQDEFIPEAMAVSGLSAGALKKTGTPPGAALLAFETWVNNVVPPGFRPVFVAFNAPFDWMFIQDYFIRYLGHNPFGHSALDIKAYYMGQTGGSWAETSMTHVSTHLLEERHLSHNALNDAQDQAEIFHMLLQRARTPGGFLDEIG